MMSRAEHVALDLVVLDAALHVNRREVETQHGPGAWDVADVMAVVREVAA
jgi:hypothetical protein